MEIIFYCFDYLRDLIFAASTITKPSLESAEQIFRFCDVVKTISKNSLRSLTTQDVRLMGRKDAISLDFSAFSNGMMNATLQILGQLAREKDELNMDSDLWRGPSIKYVRSKVEGGGQSKKVHLLFLWRHSIV